ncbi:hypothetical protein F4604DRAFT_1686069 [Suillus subluteus]|nr:hypothetical protein F4604DRAFT_1686069 [Suillus subluteus]
MLVRTCLHSLMLILACLCLFSPIHACSHWYGSELVVPAKNLRPSEWVWVFAGYGCRGGTGTIPFMSHKLLSQLVDADMANWSITTLNHSHKRASGTTPKTLPTIEQGYADNLESVLWVFLWVLLNYLGPLGMEWGKKGLMMEGWINPDTTTCIGAKYVLFRSGKATFLLQIHQYFKDLTALMDTLLEIMRHNDEELCQADEFSPE